MIVQVSSSSLLLLYALLLPLLFFRVVVWLSLHLEILMRNSKQLALLSIDHFVFHIQLKLHIFELPNVKKVVVRPTVAIELVLAALMPMVVLIELLKLLLDG